MTSKLLLIAVAALFAASTAEAKPKKRAVPQPIAQQAKADPAEVTASKVCKDEADAKGLHEQERKVFRKTCMRNAVAGAKATAAAERAVKSVAGEVTPPANTQR